MKPKTLYILIAIIQFHAAYSMMNVIQGLSTIFLVMGIFFMALWYEANQDSKKQTDKDLDPIFDAPDGIRDEWDEKNKVRENQRIDRELYGRKKPELNLDAETRMTDEQIAEYLRTKR